MNLLYNCLLRRVRLLVCLLLLLAGLDASAQDGPPGNDIIVKGIVRSDTAALEGVTVSLKNNPSRATRTSDKGHYQLKVPANGTLVFSFIGYKKQEIDVRGDNVVNVTMKNESSS